MQKLIYTQNAKCFFHVRPLLCRARMIFKNFQIFWLNYNLALHTYGKLLSLIFLNLGSIIYFCNSIKLFCSPDGPIDQPLNSIKRFYNRETNVYQTPLPFCATQRINPFLNSIISANYEKGEEFQIIRWNPYTLIVPLVYNLFIVSIYNIENRW